MTTITEHVWMGDSPGADGELLLEAYRENVQALLPADFSFEAILCHGADSELGAEGLDTAAHHALDSLGVCQAARQACWERALEDTP
jgi:hypothetical protein